jgi:hypothetical protein
MSAAMNVKPESSATYPLQRPNLLTCFSSCELSMRLVFR